VKAAAGQAALFVLAAGTAGAGVVAAEFFNKFLVAVDPAFAAFDARFAVESPSGACSWLQKLKS
jgi:hypothetical protein